MSDAERWEPPEHVEPWPDRSAELSAAMKQLAEASRRAAEETRRLIVPLTLESLGLTDWDHEMDNCYPGFGS